MTDSTEHALIDWSRRWTRAPSRDKRDRGEIPGVGVYYGSTVDGVDERIETVIKLWHELKELPADWERGMGELLLSKQEVDVRRRTPSVHYVRDDQRTCSRTHAPEHELEWQVLDKFKSGSTLLGATVLDAVNAVPLTKIPGGRAGNVEVDIVFYVEGQGVRSLQLVEAKAAANNAWFAVVEALRQLALFEASSKSSAVRQLMNHRNSLPGLSDSQLVARSVVLAPRAFYEAEGQKKKAVEPARELIERANSELGAECGLAIWDQDARTKRLPGSSWNFGDGPHALLVTR